jgi:AmiR/NasT family two-component response regulator
MRIGQALADVATIGILQERAIRRRDILAEQLQAALNSRVMIEQAKGILAERGRLDLSDAFNLLRSQARFQNMRLSDLARDVITGATTTEALLRPGP